ncbi:MAG: hypothetical protein IJ797_00540 [Selenomonadaceae bacterium]|nr:hypothetical protein [Selenomonadaceae bacterium]
MKKTILMMIFSFVISISVTNANYYENDPIFNGGYDETNWGKYFVEVTYRGMSGYAHSKYITIIPRTIKNYP